jgi:hypothetical protein
LADCTEALIAVLEAELANHTAIAHPSAPAAYQPRTRLDPPRIIRTARASNSCGRPIYENDLMYSYPDKDVTAMSEQDLLEAINRLDVKQESKLIHRIVYIKNIYTNQHTGGMKVLVGLLVYFVEFRKQFYL